MATILRKKGRVEEAISYEKMALEGRREADTAFYYVYYHNLADLYAQLDNADSTAHYARLAYDALQESQAQRTEKRILELEKSMHWLPARLNWIRSGESGRSGDIRIVLEAGVEAKGAELVVEEAVPGLFELGVGGEDLRAQFAGLHQCRRIFRQVGDV